MGERSGWARSSERDQLFSPLAAEQARAAAGDHG